MDSSVEKIEDKRDIIRFLESDRLYAAYAIGDLEPPLFGETEWYGDLEEGEINTLCLRFKARHPDVIFVMGAAEGLRAILERVLKIRRASFALKLEHLSAVTEFYSLQKLQEMFRMVLDPDEFVAVDGPVVRLGPGHVRLLQELYRLGGDVAFAPYQVRQGVFYGVEKDHQLVSTAGTHLVSRTYGLGIVGNVFTHPDHRRQGYAALCTSAVVEELLSQSLDVVLNVQQDNEPAIQLYQRQGFRVYCPFLEAFGRRKGALWRRLFGRS